MSIKTVVLGASGYVGGELLRLIARHPDFELAAAVSDGSAGKPVADSFGHLSQACAGVEFVARADWHQSLGDGDKVALFCAAPHGEAAKTIAGVLETAARKSLDIHIVDASADFRFSDQAQWESIYGQDHGAPELLDQFTCAVPEHLAEVATPHVGHPGCFATASLLATVPLMQSGLTEPEVFISGVTGSTGSGKSPQAGTHHPERNSNMYAYKPLAHRHAPEVAGLATAASGRETKVNFVPHSGPFARGIHITLQAKAKAPVDQDTLLKVYEDAYAGSPFVQIVDGTPRLKNVVASNQCHIGVATNGDTVVVFSAIDNLMKGAAGGAMQWMNRLWNLPETAGLDMPAPGWT